MKSEIIDLKDYEKSENTSALHAELWRNGLAVLDERLDEDLLQRLIAEVSSELTHSPFDFEVDGNFFYGERIRRAVSLTHKCPSILEVLALPVVEKVLAATLLDYCEHALVSTVSGLEVSHQPTAKPQFLHRDEGIYGKVARVEGGMEYTMNLMIAGTEFTKENGATHLVPGSNRWPADRYPTEADPITQLVLPRGGMGVWLGSTYHGAGVNRTQTPRLGIIFTFCLGFLRTIDNQYLSFDIERVKTLPPVVQRLLGYDAHGPSLGTLNEGSPMKQWAAPNA